jgi:integrase
MALVKRSKIWHAHFFLDGVRYRQSLKTSDWREAQAKEKALIAEIASGRSLASHREFAKWPFDKAVEHYLESRKLHLAERSLAKERELLSHPRRFFRSLSLARLTPEMLREYLAKRKAEGLSNVTINMEAGALRRLLKMAKRWHLFVDDMKRLPEEAHIGRALTSAELNGLLGMAQSRPRWVGLRSAILLAVNTTMRSVELKNLRWNHIDLFDRTITVRRSKTAAGAESYSNERQCFGGYCHAPKAGPGACCRRAGTLRIPGVCIRTFRPVQASEVVAYGMAEPDKVNSMPCVRLLAEPWNGLSKCSVQV